MRNQHQSDFIDLLDELNQHISQAKALVAYMGTDLSQNNGFTVTDEVIDGTLWTVQTLLNNAENVADRISKWNRQGGENV